MTGKFNYTSQRLGHWHEVTIRENNEGFKKKAIDIGGGGEDLMKHFMLDVTLAMELYYEKAVEFRRKMQRGER